MLELRDIRKTYKIGEIETKALDGVSVTFREKEFVAILGSSGSGKTTCLNVIGGLDRYDSGDLLIQGRSTKEFKPRDWDAYRNNTIGFVFQSYNLITHLSIVANVELGMTLSGVSSSEKHRRALEVLDQVGLSEHLHKKPNQLSGGQMQRVAIARALANDPQILLCDEPTGALDTETSRQIMDLIQEQSKDRLVIMVTHNPDLARDYADRIIRFQDGKLIDDSNPYNEKTEEKEYKLKKSAMKFRTALHLSFNNIMTKKGRTFLTAFASSIGIIGIAVILSLSNGFQMQIDDFQSDALAEFPIIISQTSMEVDPETIQSLHSEMQQNRPDQYADTDGVLLYHPSEMKLTHENKLTDEYLDYLEGLAPEVCSNIGQVRITGMNMLRKDGEDYSTVSVTAGISGVSGGMMTSMSGVGLSAYPVERSENGSYLEKNYDLIAGSYPQEVTDLVLTVDTRNRLDADVMKALGFDTEDADQIPFEKIIGTQYKLLDNDDYYEKTEYGTYMPRTDYKELYEAENNLTLRIVGVVRQKEDVEVGVLEHGLVYSEELVSLVLERARDSEIVKAQKDTDINVMTMEKMDESTKTQMMIYLGGESTPYMVLVYPTSFEAKDEITAYLDAYNEEKDNDEQVLYTDLAGTITNMTSSIMDGITTVLIAFAAISLVVSLIMICIITYTSVLERTKEIGILRALGARKKDITRVFDAETTILGVFSGIWGVFVAWLLTFPVNAILYHLTELENIAQLNIMHVVVLVIISTVLTILGGHIPARMASRKDAVEALRSE